MTWIISFVVAVAVLVSCGGGYRKDDTDPRSGVSGMSLYVDVLTGCHYLGHGFGGLTPRLDASGHQICDAK